MNKRSTKLLALFLALALILSLMPSALAAEPTAAAAEAPTPNGMHVQTPYGLRLGSDRAETHAETEELPSSYNSVDLGIVRYHFDLARKEAGLKPLWG